VDQPVEKISVWMPTTAEAMADAPYLLAVFEYHTVGAVPLTLRERVTGYRHFTSSEGLEMRFYVGWRARWNRLVEFVMDSRDPLDLDTDDE
jgi:hypothetical protein